MTGFHIPNIPGELQWENFPLDWKIGADRSLTVIAGEKTDWFCDPAKKIQLDNAPVALFQPPDKNFLLSTKITVNFVSTFDAGGIQIREKSDLWAKLCFEFSPQHQPMIVSVVTRGESDDCSSVTIDSKEAFLRVTLTPDTVAFHYSLDGSYWHFVRYFSIGLLKNLRVGFSAQAPMSKQCIARFSEIIYRAGVLKDKRSGE